MSLPEVLLWKALRNRQARGCLRFRRQHPLDPYVLDVYCDEIRLAVEIDGQTHTLGDHPLRDARRDAWLAARGVRTLRIDAGEVLASPESVAAAVAAAVEDTTWLSEANAAHRSTSDAAAFDSL